MSEREHLKQVIDQLPEFEKTAIEEVEPDEWDLEMIEQAKKENDGQGIPIETLADKLGITL